MQVEKDNREKILQLEAEFAAYVELKKKKKMEKNAKLVIRHFAYNFKKDSLKIVFFETEKKNMPYGFSQIFFWPKTPKETQKFLEWKEKFQHSTYDVLTEKFIEAVVLADVHAWENEQGQTRSFTEVEDAVRFLYGDASDEMKEFKNMKNFLEENGIIELHKSQIGV